VELLDLYPIKSFFLPGETIALFAEVDTPQAAIGRIRLRVLHLAQIVDQFDFPIKLQTGIHRLLIKWRAVNHSPASFGISAYLHNDHDQLLSTCFSAFDVLDSWLDYPRYGFVTDFTPGREDIDETLDLLVRHHINGLQFYDWGYRHDSLLPVDQIYRDPLDRELSLTVIADFISAAHSRGMAAMPYLAVYAASLDFWRLHRDWGLFDQAGNPLLFEKFLALMDPSPGSHWRAHLLRECDRLQGHLPFDGFHVDQYGDPKTAFNYLGNSVDLPSAFRSFISDLKNKHPDKAVVFNAVGNWPIEDLATSAQDFSYIEVWPNTPLYTDLIHIVTGALHLSDANPVVIALYQPAQHLPNILLASATLFASGGTRILLGERECLLADPYFPKHQPLTAELQHALRRYHDFCVRYGEWLGPWVQQQSHIEVELPNGVWSIPRETPGWLVVNLINTTGIDQPYWDKQHDPPLHLERFQVSISGIRNIHSVWWSSPDIDDPSLVPAPWDYEDGIFIAEIPHLHYWSLLAIELNG